MSVVTANKDVIDSSEESIIRSGQLVMEIEGSLTDGFPREYQGGKDIVLVSGNTGPKRGNTAISVDRTGRRQQLHRAEATPRARTVSERSVPLLVEHRYASLGTVRGGRPDPLQRPFGRCEISVQAHTSSCCTSRGDAARPNRE